MYILADYHHDMLSASVQKTISNIAISSVPAGKVFASIISVINTVAVTNAFKLQASTYSRTVTMVIRSLSSRSTSPSSSASLSSSGTSRRAVQAFRQNVLAPYGIRVYDAPSKQVLPKRLLRLIEDLSQNLTQFDHQLNFFKERLGSTDSFSCIDLLSTHLLPTFSYETRLTRSLGALFSRQALPEQAYEAETRPHAPSIPHASFASGFSCSAFSLRELSSMPPALTCQGVVENGTTNLTSPINTTFYGSFLTFQQAHGSSEAGFDAARHQCAINGACNIRALQKVTTLADQKMRVPQPQTFSCCINRESATINHHWVDKHQNYCMAPICRFELSKDNHVRLLMAWVGAIERWAVIELLPQIKGALGHVPETELSPPSTPEHQPTAAAALPLCDSGNYDLLTYSLKTNIEALPCHPDNSGDDESNGLSPTSNSNRQPCSSATASWDSFTPTLLALPKLPITRLSKEPKETAGAGSEMRSDRRQSLDRLRQRRMDHAMNEVHEIEIQLQNVRKETRGLIRALRDEMTRLKQVHEALEDELVGAKRRVCGIENEAVYRATTENATCPPEANLKLSEKSIGPLCDNLSISMKQATTKPITLRTGDIHTTRTDSISAPSQCYKDHTLPPLKKTSSFPGQERYSSSCAVDLTSRRLPKSVKMHHLPPLQTFLPTVILRDTISTPIQVYHSIATYRNRSPISIPTLYTDNFATPSSVTFSRPYAPTPPQTREIPCSIALDSMPVKADALIERLLMLPSTPYITSPDSPATTIQSEYFFSDDDDYDDNDMDIDNNNNHDSSHRPIYFGLGIDIPEIDSMESATAELLSVYSDDNSHYNSNEHAVVVVEDLSQHQG